MSAADEDSQDDVVTEIKGAANETKRLKLTQFDPRSIKLGSAIFVIGKRGSGKSVLMRSLVYGLSQRPGRKIELGIGMSPSEEASPSLVKFLPRTLIHTAYSKDVVANLIASQKRSLKKGNAYDVLLILDDCIFDRAVLKSQTFRELLMVGRHYRITVIVLVQYMLDITPDARSNIDIVISTRNNVLTEREKLHKYFFGIFGKYKDFSKAFDACTNNWSTIVLVNNSSPTNTITDNVFWFRAPLDTPDFRLGADWVWRMDRKFYKDREEEIVQKEKEKADEKKEIGDVVVADTDGRTVLHF